MIRADHQHMQTHSPQHFPPGCLLLSSGRLGFRLRDTLLRRRLPLLHLSQPPLRLLLLLSNLCLLLLHGRL